MENKKSLLLELYIDDGEYRFPSTISTAILDANSELKELEDKIEETTETVKALTPECDKLDYILSASSGALCGVLDVFLVGKPGESPLGNITDKWFENRTIDFAKLCGYKGDESLSSAISFLEKKYKVPYDQSVGGGIFKELLNLTPDNHHFKSLGHNPTLLYAITYYLRHTSSILYSDFARRIRIVNNLIQNSVDEVSDRIDRNRIPAVLAQTEAIIATGKIDDSIENSFNVNQLSEEKEKIAFLDVHPEQAETLFKLEDHPMLKGQISIVGIDNLSLADKFAELFTCKVICLIAYRGDE